MKILIKKVNEKYVEIISLKELESFQKNLEIFSSVKSGFEINIFAIDEIISSHQLKNLKINLEKIDFCSLNIFSNKRETVLTGKSLKINSTYLNEKDLKNRLVSLETNDQRDQIYRGTVRSGDRICSNGDLFVVGDVNPGAIISAKRNIFVWGKLLGIAFAGEGGNNNAFIAALYLNPLQIRINEVVAIGPKEKPKDYYPEMAVIEKKSIVIKPYLIDASRLINQN